jgi:hypothetical protein
MHTAERRIGLFACEANSQQRYALVSIARSEVMHIAYCQYCQYFHPAARRALLCARQPGNRQPGRVR